VVAVPVASYQAVFILRQEVDEVFCVRVPDDFEGVGRWFEDFSQTTDEEVRRLLENTSRMPPLYK
jgi:predicted phosphoribosyltransferase